MEHGEYSVPSSEYSVHVSGDVELGAARIETKPSRQASRLALAESNQVRRVAARETLVVEARSAGIGSTVNVVRTSFTKARGWKRPPALVSKSPVPPDGGVMKRALASPWG